MVQWCSIVSRGIDLIVVIPSLGRQLMVSSAGPEDRRSERWYIHRGHDPGVRPTLTLAFDVL
jgi:hypothetical protein